MATAANRCWATAQFAMLGDGGEGKITVQAGEIGEPDQNDKHARR
jgi:hypothetical protein